MYLNVATAMLAIEHGLGDEFALGDGANVNSAFFDAVAVLGAEDAAELVADLRSEMHKNHGT